MNNEEENNTRESIDPTNNKYNKKPDAKVTDQYECLVVIFTEETTETLRGTKDIMKKREETRDVKKKKSSRMWHRGKKETI